MNKEQYISRLQAIINTLNAATLRADQIDAVQRISACTMELQNLIKELEKQDQPQKG